MSLWVRQCQNKVNRHLHSKCMLRKVLCMTTEWTSEQTANQTSGTLTAFVSSALQEIIKCFFKHLSLQLSNSISCQMSIWNVLRSQLQQWLVDEQNYPQLQASFNFTGMFCSHCKTNLLNRQSYCSCWLEMLSLVDMKCEVVLCDNLCIWFISS